MALISGVLIAHLSDRQTDGEKRVKAIAGELRQANAELTSAQANLAEAKRLQAWLGASAKHVDGIVKERDALSWTPALRRIVATAGDGIQLREVRARRGSDEIGTWTILVGGISSGSAPRAVADSFRTALERELGGVFDGGVTARFERLDDATESAADGRTDGQAVFTIVATIDVTEGAGAKRKKGA